MPRSEHFAALVARLPDNELFRFSLAQALLAEGQPAAAIEHLVICANKKLDWMMPRILIGKTFLTLQQKADARTWLEQALHLAVTQNHDDPAQELRQLLAELS